MCADGKEKRPEGPSSGSRQCADVGKLTRNLQRSQGKNSHEGTGQLGEYEILAARWRENLNSVKPRREVRGKD